MILIPDPDLIAAARIAAVNAYSPYSRFNVGCAAVFVGANDIYTGCNVENASYGLTLCAERVAICKAASENRRQLVKLAVAVVDQTGLPQKSFMPCGACLQFMQEFSAGQDVEVIIDGVGACLLKDLLPRPF